MIKNFKRISLIVHIGKEGDPSKTEYMFIPPYKMETNQSPLKQYPNADDQVTVEGGYITFCSNFKYLGSLINPTLDDEYTINMRI